MFLLFNTITTKLYYCSLTEEGPMEKSSTIRSDCPLSLPVNTSLVPD